MNDLRRSWIAATLEVQEAVSQVLRRGSYVHGPEHEALQQEFAELIGTRGAVAVNSGTDALRIALLAVGCTPGDRVLVAANAGGYAATATASIGCFPLFADVSEQEHLLTADSVLRALTPAVRAVVVTHLYGNVADVAGIRAICDPLGIPVIEDCAQAVGAKTAGGPVGSLGTAAAFSFYPTKNLGGAGDGGMVTSSEPSVLESAQSLRQYGWSTKYHIQRSRGINSRLDEIQAAILRVGLPNLASLNAERLQIAQQYAAALEGTTLRLVNRLEAGAVVHLAVVVAPDPETRMLARSKLSALGVQTDVHYPTPDHLQPGLAGAHHDCHLPVTEGLAGRIFSIPLFNGMSQSEVEYVCEGLRTVCGGTE